MILLFLFLCRMRAVTVCKLGVVLKVYMLHHTIRHTMLIIFYMLHTFYLYSAVLETQRQDTLIQGKARRRKETHQDKVQGEKNNN